MNGFWLPQHKSRYRHFVPSDEPKAMKWIEHKKRLCDGKEVMVYGSELAPADWWPPHCPHCEAKLKELAGGSNAPD